MTIHRANPTTTAVLDLVGAKGVLRPVDLQGLGIARTALQRLERQGRLVRLGRGLYALAGAEMGESAALAAVSRRVPDGIVCLLSALRFHHMTTENPSEIWLAIDRKARRPVIAGLRLRIARFKPALLREGIEFHRIDGVEVQVTTPARTVADCFKYRAKIGMDVALAALQSYVWDRKGTADDLWREAVNCRVANVMRPYLESAR
jgi:predicted transcriptional regulator of viral defense system